jgi:hypothetical protein
MIFLLNREHVLGEVMELARLHICEVLKLRPDQVEATLDLAGGTISPEFQVDLDDCPGISPDEIREVMRHAYADCKEEALVRLKGIEQTREQVLTWNRGGMTDEEYAAVTDPAAIPDSELVPQGRGNFRFLMAKAGWRLRDAVRWVRLVMVGVLRRILRR